MLDIPSLDALDLTVWYEGGYEVARASGCVPSTVLRRVRHALKTFDLRLQRSRSGWQLLGDQELIAMERRIHQLHRLRGGGPPRLHLPAWTQRLLAGRLPPGWLCNPCNGRPACGNPLRLLRERVIDACVLTPTQLSAAPEAAGADLALLDCLPLYSSAIELYGSSDDPALPLPRQPLQACLEGRMRLQLPWFLPFSCQRSVRHRFQGLLGAGGDAPLPPRTTAPWSATFLTAEMALLLPGLRRLEQRNDWPYSETLVVLRDTCQHAAIRRLRPWLQEQLCLPQRDRPVAMAPAGLQQKAPLRGG